MKNLKFSLLIVSLSGMLLLSCKKDSNNVAIQNRSLPKIYERTLKVSDAGNTQSVSLRFRGLSKEVLASLPLDKFEFKLVKTPSSVLDNRTDKNIPTASDKAALVKNQNQDLNSLDALRLSGKAVYADVISDSRATSLSIEIKSKTTGVTSTESTWPDGTAVYLIGGSDWHRVQINNLSSTPLNVSFYYDSCDDDICTWTSDGKGTINQYSGYSYTLYQGGWAWYYNCNKGVGAYMVIPPENAYWFTWTLWSNCQP